MAFDEVELPRTMAYGYQAGGGFSTDIVVTGGGHEKRNQNWLRARHKFEIDITQMQQNELDVLVAFFLARNGRARGFRLYDWADHVIAGGSIGTGDGTTTTFQIVKHYESGGRQYTRRITKPVLSTVVVRVGNVGASIVTASVQTQGTVVVTAPATGQAVSVSCEFDVPVRFDTDQMFITIEAYEQNNWQGIPLIEIRDVT